MKTIEGVAGVAKHFDADQYELKLYVWDLTVRITHWAIAFSLWTLSVTGFYIGRPFLVVTGEAGEHFAMGWMRIIHFYAAIVFTLAVLARVLWMFIGPRRASWRELVPTEKERVVGLWSTFLFYILLKDSPPRSPGHNPLAGLTYNAVYFLYFVMIVSGLGLYGMQAHVDSIMHSFAPLVSLFMGAVYARWIHHIVMWLLLGFFVHHIFSAILIAAVKKNGTMESIFSGYKWVHQHEAEREANRWAEREKK